MRDGDLLILKWQEVAALLEGRELEIMEAVRAAYEAHAGGGSALPHSLFLRFPDSRKNRIIALPAYLKHNGGGIAGIKWVSSFPDNLSLGLDRASAVLVLNSTLTGRPEALIEASLISAKRTAASAALAAQYLHAGKQAGCLGIVGAGLINHEIARFLLVAFPGVTNFIVHDLDLARAQQFKRKCESEFDGVSVEITSELNAVLRDASLISFATTAVEPHVHDLNACASKTILHVSLRDLSPEVILACDNVVDDVDHVCRAQTSIHLAEQVTGNRDFIRCTLADILKGDAPPRRDQESIAVFSPFGLGILDIVVGKLVIDLAAGEAKGAVISSFLPAAAHSA